MRKFLCQVQFDGKKYFGFQANGNTKTIQQQLQAALAKLFMQNITVEGCSRTDAGVSALQYYFAFCADTKLPADRVCFKLNRFLPSDIQCQSSVEVNLNYNVRQNIKTKTYMYKIYFGNHIQPLLNKNSVFVKGDLNYKAIKDCAPLFVGKHNFKAFCNPNAEASNFVKTIQSIKVEKQANQITFYITANSFLYNMVRVLVGTLILCGNGTYTKQDVLNLFDVQDRAKNKAITMPAKGLMLYAVDVNN